MVERGQIVPALGGDLGLPGGGGGLTYSAVDIGNEPEGGLPEDSSNQV